MIRRAVLSDLPSIVEIYNQTVPLRNVTADTQPVSVESRMAWFEGFTEDRPLLVLEKNGQVVAWLSIKSFYGRPAYHKTVEIGLYIDQEHRGHGIGSSLLMHAIHEADKLNIETFLAFIFDNNEASLRFFKKYGFVQWGLLPAIAEIEDVKIGLIIAGLKV